MINSWPQNKNFQNSSYDEYFEEQLLILQMCMISKRIIDMIYGNKVLCLVPFSKACLTRFLLQNFQRANPNRITAINFLSTGSFPLSSQNQLTPAQRQALLPVMESVLKVMESNKPSVNDVNTLMVQVRDLLKKVPEGYLPNLRQFGFEGLDGLDLDVLKNVALKETGDIAITENGQDKIVTSFGKHLNSKILKKCQFGILGTYRKSSIRSRSLKQVYFRGQTL